MKNNIIPNLDSELKDKTVAWINFNKPFQTLKLDEGQTFFHYPKIIEMLSIVEGRGNNYVLLCGASCYNDIIKLEDYNRIFWQHNIILFYDYRVANYATYLIPLESYNPITMSSIFVSFIK